MRALRSLTCILAALGLLLARDTREDSPSGGISMCTSKSPPCRIVFDNQNRLFDASARRNGFPVRAKETVIPDETEIPWMLATLWSIQAAFRRQYSFRSLSNSWTGRIESYMTPLNVQ